MNEQGNRRTHKVRFNLLDGIIVLLVLLCIVGVCFRDAIIDQLGFGVKLEQYRISFKIEDVDSKLPDFTSSGDKLYYSDSVEAGALLAPPISEFASGALTVTPAAAYASDGNGNVVYVTYPEGTIVDAEGAFVCEGAYNQNGYFAIGGEKLVTVGQQITLYTDTVTLNMTVTNIEEYHR